MAGETSLLSRHFSSYELAGPFSARPQRQFCDFSDKILGLKRKVNLRKNHFVKGNLEMFSQLLELESEGGYQQVLSLVENHLEELQNIIKHYLPSVSTQV
jgi:hypothetical protein